MLSVSKYVAERFALRCGVGLVATTCMLASAFAQPPENADVIVKETDARIEVFRGDQLVIAYNKTAPPRPEGIAASLAHDGFIHPVNTPAGQTLTAVYPADHAHQSGIFSAWVNTTYDGKQLDFWNFDDLTAKVAHHSVDRIFNEESQVGFDVTLHHSRSGDTPLDILRDRWNVRIIQADASHTTIDITTTQEALTDLPLVVNKYTYGGMAIRGRSSWLKSSEATQAGSDGMRMVNSRGEGRNKGNHQHVRWVAMHGPIGQTSGCIVVMSHKDNFRAPQAARLHSTKPYFTFAPCVDGGFTIDREHPLTGKFRYLISTEMPTPESIDARWKQWCGE